ncbi:unnamed protein product [Arctia plantaginis]|uniref:Uncharacterized protein n=1 Tax=Arctia plantaginis TaxID=874455 RepID=A0A8S1AJV2_ARCPL|nr:unnamed protein product [Arctia plantaginis]
MSIIAVDNVPIKVSLKGIVKVLQKPIRGQFEALNFGKSNNSNLMKICYLRLSERLDPVHVVESINNLKFKGKGNLFALIPKKVPDIPLGISSKSKRKRVPSPMRKKARIAEENAGGKIVDFTTNEIMSELQAKYPGLVGLSAKYNHKLLQDIAKVIHGRVEVLVSRSPELEESCFKSTGAYRRAHPHFGDFQLVLSTLHAIQDAAGTPRQQLQESDITTANSTQRGQEMPMEHVKSLCQRYSAKIYTKMTEHVSGLDATLHQMDTEEETARKQIRMELKKLQPFLSQIVNEVVNTQCLPQERKLNQIRIYGEPFLPNKETMMPFLSRFRPKRPMRSTRMFNMLMLSVPFAVYPQLLAMNGTVLNGAKLSIVSSDAVRSSSWQLKADGEEESDDENMDEEQENWD